jgi:hypothetical protein
MRFLALWLIFILTIHIVLCNQGTYDDSDNSNDQNDTEDGYDAMLSRFGKNSDENLSVDDIISAMSDTIRSGGMDYSSGYY